jgi:predicted amidohydrolase
MADTLTIACLQTDPVIGDVDANLARQRSMVAEAVERGAGMVVLPECSTGGYVFDSPDEAATVAEDIAAGDGPALMAWQQWCAQYGIHLVARPARGLRSHA